MENRCAIANSVGETCLAAEIIGGCHGAAVLCTQVIKQCTYLDLNLPYILISGTHSKFARENNFLALSVCFTQTCSSAGRMLTASRSRLHTTDQLFSSRLGAKAFRLLRAPNNEFDEMPYNLDSSENPRSLEKHPTPPSRPRLSGHTSVWIAADFEWRAGPSPTRAPRPAVSMCFCVHMHVCMQPDTDS